MLNIFKDLMYTETEIDVEERFVSEILGHYLIEEYPNFLNI